MLYYLDIKYVTSYNSFDIDYPSATSEIRYIILLLPVKYDIDYPSATSEIRYDIDYPSATSEIRYFTTFSYRG